jgi:hypothetical protein
LGDKRGPFVFGTPPIAARVLGLLIRHLPEVTKPFDDEMAAQGLTQEVLNPPSNRH